MAHRPVEDPHFQETMSRLDHDLSRWAVEALSN